MNGRIYDPFIARFMSPDPFTQDPGNLQGYNRYSYVINNPMKYVDPSGYRTISMQEAIYYLLNSSEHGGTWTSTGGGGGEVNDFSNSDHAFVAGAVYLNQHNAWGENGNNSPFKAYNAYFVSKGGKTNVKAISRNDYTLNNPGTDYFERHFNHFEINNSNKGKIDFFNFSAANSGGNLPSWPENSAAALGTLAGMMEAGKVSGDMWYSPKAGKWYPVANQPNGITGPRNPVLKSANTWHNIAKGAFYAGAIYSTGDMIYYYATGGTGWEKAAWTGADIAVGAIAMWGGPPGMAIGIVYMIVTNPGPNITPSPYVTDPMSPWNTMPRIDNTGINNGGGF